MKLLDHEKASEDLVWAHASSARPCPICGADHACRVHDREGFVSCTQVRSEWPLTTGAWLHREPGAQALSGASEAGGAARSSVTGSRAALAHRFARLYADEGRRR